MEQLIQHLKSYYPLSDEASKALSDCLEEKYFAKNDYLIKAGRICRYFYFMERGALRGFYNLNGREITHWFGFENTFITSFHSYITEQPSVENIQFMEGSIMWAIAKKDLTDLFDRYHELERLVRIIYENYYIRLEERYVNAQFKTAAELYSDLMEKSPHILERVPLGYVSSYLGMTQETLSRIRKLH
ncbi:MAG TPA: cyclic nucleotide-binding domain-containing protein [Niabella sp.]|nr:cyclic nucleotide-binding domain-containing protein [Niabella sp.]